MRIEGKGIRLLHAGKHRRYFTSSPDDSTFWGRVVRQLRTVTDAVATPRCSLNTTDPDELLCPVAIYVWVRWFSAILVLVLLIYRPEFTYFIYSVFTLLLALFVALNGYLHYRVRSGRAVTLHWMLVLSALDIVFITAGVVVAGGFGHPFFFLLYFPALAWFAVFFSSFRLSLAWATLVAVVYASVSVGVPPGLDFEARDEKTVIARIFAMYAVVASVSLVSRFERVRRQDAVARERELQRERIELSQTIHDTTAQSVYMIGLGLDTAVELAGESNRELLAKLEATSALSKSAMWELRHPINMGFIFEGRELGRVLTAHAATFTAITSVPAELVQAGTEPSLSPATRSTLYSIAHNALTNALRHARASNVTIALDFQERGLRMSLSDNGIGLPDNYAERGHGFTNMRADAERIGGRLEVQSGGSGAGTTVTCVVEGDSM